MNGSPSKRLLLKAFICLAAAWHAGWCPAGHAAPPKVDVTNIRRVFHNGEHNAFTDLVRFKDRYYLTFRSCPDGHMVHPTASIIILSSRDARAWHQVHRFSVRHRDTRDPHFLVFNDRLFVFTGTWYSGEKTLPRNQYDLNKHLGYGVWSDNGESWTNPVILEGTFGHYIWRAAPFGGKAYLCGRRKIGFEVTERGEGRKVESLMLESDDGLIWRKRAVFQAIAGDETAFLFQPGGGIVAIGRRGSGTAQLLRSKPPYTEWDRKDLGRYIGGPLIARWGKRIVVGGRKFTDGRGSKTSMCWLTGDALKEFAELPSGGDCSYPGFIPLSDTRAIMSWYSSHEKNMQGGTMTAIYMADLNVRSDASTEAEAGFVPIFNGRSLDGWEGLNGSTDSYYVKDGMLVCKKTGKEHIFTQERFSNFILRLQIRMDPGGNNGVGIRTRKHPAPHLQGMEIQVLDDGYYADGDPLKLLDYQHHGSIYGVVPAKTGHLRPAGQWNDEEIICDGRRVKVILNGTVIVDAHLDEVKPLDHKAHPGLQFKEGRISLHAHGNYGAEVFFRNIRVKKLD